MKKLIFLIALIVSGMQCYAQTDDDEPLMVYINPHFYTSLESFGFGLDLDFEHQVGERMYVKTDLGLCYSPKSERMYGTAFSIALKYNFIPCLFALFDMQPNIRVHGTGHQVNGDNLVFYVRSGIGLGAIWEFYSGHQIYFEGKVCTNIILYDETKAYNGKTYWMIGIGYRKSFL